MEPEESLGMAHLIYTEPLLFESGDRLGRDEFLDRWEQTPTLRFAELIDGVVYLPSPVSLDHAEKDHLIQLWTGLYASRSGMAQVLPNATWMMQESAPQPDVTMRLRPEFGGQSGNAGKYPAGAPEFVAEVSRSTRSYDLGPKLELYERARVGEYLVVLLEEERLEWRILRDRRFQLIPPESDRIRRSVVFPGLWLDEPAFWRNDAPAVLAVLERGMQSDEFTRFQANRRSQQDS